MKIGLIILSVWNVITALVYGADKMRAIKGAQRIRECVLLVLAFSLGGVGAMFGMIVFNHKTSKYLFRFLVPTAVIVNLIVMYKFGTWFF